MLTIKNKKFTRALITVAIVLGSFMGSVDTGGVVISLGAISRHFDASTTAVSWVIIAYILVYTSFLITFGRLGDIIGHRNVFIAGFVLFTASSFFCGISGNILELIIFRGLQGAGGAMITSSGPAIISHAVHEDIRGRAFGWISTASGFGFIAGFGLVGLITHYFGWQWIFFVNVPIGIIALVIAFCSIPETVSRLHTRRSFDFQGAVLIFVSAGIFIYAISFGNENGWFSPITLSAFILAACLACLTIAWEKRAPFPVLDLSLLRDRRIATGIGAVALSGVAISGTLFLIPLDLDLVKGYTSGFTGLLLGAGSLLIVLSAPIAGTLSDRIGSKILCMSAGVLLLVSLAIFAFCDETVSLALIVVSIILRSLEVGLFMSPNLKQVMACCAEKHAGALSGVYAFFKSLGATLGIVLMETIFDMEVRSPGSINTDGAVHLSLPIPDTVAAFHSAFFVGMIFCIGMIVLSAMMQEKRGRKTHSGWRLANIIRSKERGISEAERKTV